MSVHLFGVRHHGPGCARALRSALETLKPDILLVEGPPDAHAAVPLLASKKMQPPVALLIYVPDAPQRAVFYPFTTFSPEWQALSYALARRIPARFMDLPQEIQLAREPAVAEETPGGPESPITPDLPAAADSARPHASAAGESNEGATAAAVAAAEPAAPPPDPMALLAQAAGYDDHELWWESEIEQRRDATDLFDAIFEAMDALRGDATPRDDEEAQREAHMRTVIRAAEAEGFQRIAIVSGAWHSPALARRGDPRADAAILNGLKSVKVEATWIPWTNSRLSYRSGYGAGISSPGWYGHLWAAPDRVPIRWAAQAAQLLRSEGLDASSASVIEAVRLGEALAAMRGLPMPGMAEMHEAIQTVLCHGGTSPMTLIRERLEIGEALGSVPPETPAVPLQRDLDTQIKRLRLERTAEIKERKLDLRNDTDRARSQLFHRLRLLGIEWAKPSYSGHSALGTFHEDWQLKWEPELAVALIEANVWGNTVARASAVYARHLADEADELPELSELLDRVILAELPEATEHLLARIQARAAVAADVRHLMDALPPLATVARYGNVRGTQAERVTPLIDALFTRALIGLPGACASLDDDAAAEMTVSIEHVHETVDLLNRDDQRAAWIAALRGLVTRDAIHGLVRGRAARLLLAMRALDGDELRRLAGLALSPAVSADQAAAWIEGALRGGGQALLLQDGLWRALDAWLAELSAETFVALLPLLRRAFAGFSAPERRSMGEKVRRLADAEDASASPATRGAREQLPLNHERATAVLPVLAQILGVDHHAE
ncbi:MAG TPA: DUF5682 family protein [Ktedonobacterales bacterium]|nr:DUF5682 family protein [Ktedonobacterales bacterium]